MVDKALKVMPDNGHSLRLLLAAAGAALVAGGEKAKADDIMDTMTNRSEQMLAYYATSPTAACLTDDQRGYLLGLQSVYRAAELVGDKARSDKALGLLNQYYPR